MRHKERVARYGGSLRQLAVELADMRYDALEKFLRHLAAKLKADSEADQARGRRKLSSALYFASTGVDWTAVHVAEAWRISKPFMKSGRARR